MVEGIGFHNRHSFIASKVRSLFSSLTQYPSNYDEITPKIEFWIEYILRGKFTTVDELVEGVSPMAWDQDGSYASVGRFLKEFYNAPRRSEQARSFVDKLCEYVLRWFAIAAVEDLWMGYTSSSPSVANGGGEGFVRAASFVGHVIECDVLNQDLVRQYLIKSLTAHQYTKHRGSHEIVRAIAISRLFIAAGNTLLRGLLEPEDVEVCFNTLNACVGAFVGLEAGKLQEFREIHTTWLEQRGNGNRAGAAETGAGEGGTVEAPAEIETPVAFIPRELPNATTDDDTPSSILHRVQLSSETFANSPFTATSSPTMSISTMSDLTPTELGEDTQHGEGDSTTTPSRHHTFYFADGNMEIVCGGTLFRVHCTIISFSSPKLRDILSPSTLLDAPMPEGCPRIGFTDSAEDFAVLLEMIYTPGFPARHEVPEFSVFASLLRMTTKYGFSRVRDQLIKDLKAAYPTKWDDYKAARTPGEDVFGVPKPHPNAVLNLFEAQNVRFAIPFAAYRASLSGFSVLVSDKPSTVLPRLTLASAVRGGGEIRRLLIRAAHTIVYEEKPLSVCPDSACVLNVGTRFMEQRMEALSKLHNAILGEGRGDVLSPPSLGGLTCAKCAEEIEGAHASRRELCWELLPAKFSVAKCWDEL